MSLNRRTLASWAQAAPLTAVFVVFFILPLALIVMVSFWRATDYELIPAFTLQSYADIIGGCGGPDDACVISIHNAVPLGTNRLRDADADTRVEVERTPDEDKIALLTLCRGIRTHHQHTTISQGKKHV